MTKSTIRVAIDVGSKSHWVGVGLSEGQVLERFSPTFTIWDPKIACLNRSKLL